MAITREDFVFNQWTITASQSHILPSQCVSTDDCKNENLCDFCLFSKELQLPHFPEMVFPQNKLKIEHSNGFTIEFNALDALKEVVVGEMPLKVACSDEWKMSRRSSGYVDKYVHPFDWTFSTKYCGTLDGEYNIEESSQVINIEKLKLREEILFYKEVILFEDELHDNGIALSTIKVRVMPSGFFVLCRFFLRVDGVLVRVIDTRFYYEVENEFIFREISFREGKFSEIDHHSVAVSVDPAEYMHLMPIIYCRTDKLIPNILPRGVSGDVYNLADIIFQQALVGPGPNQLILSYLKHCLSSQLVSYAAVVQRISKFDAFHKPYCVMCLLILLENIENGITCRTKQEEALLPGSIISLIGWLLDCYSYYLRNPSQFPELTKKPILLLNRFMTNPFTAAFVYLAKHENEEDYNKIVGKSKGLRKFLSEQSMFTDNLDIDVLELLKNVEKLDLDVLRKPRRKEMLLDYSVQAMLKVTVLLNPTISNDTIVNNLLTIQQLKGYKNARLYMELIRACFRNLNDSVADKCSAYWCGFTFIKLPLIIQLLARHYTHDKSNSRKEAGEEIVEAFMLLMEFCPLLNNIDTQTQNYNVQSLLTEMVTMSIISNADQDEILKIRKSNGVDVGKMSSLVPELPTTSIKDLISMTMPALDEIMESLDTDKDEQIIRILTHLAGVGSNSNELIASYAAVKGDLPHLVDRLIRFNEMSKQADEKDPLVKALIFDFTFLMLCTIVQNYGSHVVLNNQKRNSFFETWVRNCMKEYGINKAMISFDKGYDIAKTNQLIEWFKSGELDVKNPIMKWDEMCFAMPVVMKEMLHGWLNSPTAVYSVDEVKMIIHAITTEMCCLSICSVSWLSSYMQLLPEDQLLKCRHMIQFIMSMNEQKIRASTENKCSQTDLYSNKCLMSKTILRQMLNDGNLPVIARDVVPPSRGIAAKDPIYKQLVAVWEVVLQKGYLTSEAAHLFRVVISVSDIRSFMKFMLHELMKLRFEDELNKAVDLLLALFYFNIQNFTVALLNYLPHLLFKTDKLELVEPQSTAIAKLTAYVICAAVQEEFISNKSNEGTQNTDIAEDLEELCPASKIMRMSNIQTGNTPLVFVSTGHCVSSQNLSIKNVSLLKSLSMLFRAFDNVAGRTGVVNSDTYFVFNVVKQIIECGKEISKPILSDLSNSLIPNLMRSVPELFTMELILQLYNLNSSTGTKTAVRDLCLLRNLTMKS